MWIVVFIAMLCLFPVIGTAALSLSLEESINLALKNHQTINSSQADADASRWQVKSVRRNAGLSVSWNSSFYKLGGWSYSRLEKMHYNYLTLAFPLYTGGQIEHSVNQLLYQTNSADIGVEAARQQVRYQAIEAYYDLLQKKNMFNVSQSAVDMAKEQLRLLNIMFNEGAIARSDVLQMEVQLADYQQDLLSAEGDYFVARDTLLSVIGLPENTEIEPTDNFSYVPYELDLPACLDYAMNHRPDRIASEYELKGAEEQKEAAKGGYRPQIAAVYSRTLEGRKPFTNDIEDEAYLGLSFQWTIFDNGVTDATVKAAKKSAEKKVADLAEVERNVRLDVRKAYIGMRAAEDKIKNMKLAVEKAERNKNIAEIRYAEGVDTILNITNSQEKLTKARTNYYSALYEYNLYRAGLDYAMGVPVMLDVTRYVTAEQKGSNPDEAIRLSQVEQDEPFDRRIK